MDTQAKEIELNGVKYVKASTIKSTEYEGDCKIVVLQRGWVMIGIFERNGSECKLYSASVIRNWGTTKGLGEIASGGPTSSTKLDKCGGIVEFDYLTVVCAISCNEEKWKSYL